MPCGTRLYQLIQGGPDLPVGGITAVGFFKFFGADPIGVEKVGQNGAFHFAFIRDAGKPGRLGLGIRAASQEDPGGGYAGGQGHRDIGRNTASSAGENKDISGFQVRYMYLSGAQKTGAGGKAPGGGKK